MAKLCLFEDCTNPRFSGGYCRNHLYLNPKYKNMKLSQQSDKRVEEKKERSEIDVFNEIWEERPHISELSGKPLPYNRDNMKRWVCQFLHVINKGRSPNLKLDKRNIMLGTPEEHEHQDEYEEFTKRKVELLRELYIPK